MAWTDALWRNQICSDMKSIVAYFKSYWWRTAGYVFIAAVNYLTFTRYIEFHDPPAALMQSAPLQSIEAELWFPAYDFDPSGARIPGSVCNPHCRRGAMPTARFKSTDGKILCTRPISRTADLNVLDSSRAGARVLLEVHLLPKQGLFDAGPSCAKSGTTPYYVLRSVTALETQETVLGPDRLQNPSNARAKQVHALVAGLLSLFFFLVFRRN